MTCQVLLQDGYRDPKEHGKAEGEAPLLGEDSGGTAGDADGDISTNTCTCSGAQNVRVAVQNIK